MLSDKDLVDVGPERAVLVGFAVFIMQRVMVL